MGFVIATWSFRLFYYRYKCVHIEFELLLLLYKIKKSSKKHNTAHSEPSGVNCHADNVAVSILNWNNYIDTKECIESVMDIEYDNYDIILVDNNSSDDSAIRLRKNFPNIFHLQSNTNRGFAGGHNMAIKWAMENNTDYIMILNNDVLIPDSTILSELVSFLKRNPKCGIVSPMITCYPDTTSIWFQKGTLNHQVGSPQHEYTVDPNQIITNDYVPFVGVLVNVEIFKNVGLLPEGYFMYYEDVDFCTRVREAGYEILTNTNSKLWHKGNRTSGKSMDPIRSYYNTRNQWVWSRKFDYNIIQHQFYLHVSWKILFQSLRRLRYGNIAGLIALLWGSIDGIRKKDGKGPYP